MNIDAVVFAKQIVKMRKYNAEFLAEKNRTLANQNEKFSKINSQIQLISIKLAKARIDKLTNEFVKLQNELINLTEERLSILNGMNLSDDDFKPKYTCNLCNDSGICNNKLCKCVSKIINDELMIRNGINFSSLNTFKDWNTSNFEPKPVNALESAKKKILEQISDYSKMKNILLCGSAGTGKTFLQNCIAKYFYNNGYIVSYNTAFSFLDIVKEYHLSANSENKNSLLYSLIDSDILIIDDLGTEPMFKNITCEYLYTVLNSRIINKKPTVISSNLSIKGLVERYGNRIVSRMTDRQNSLCLLFDFNDLRSSK